MSEEIVVYEQENYLLPQEQMNALVDHMGVIFGVDSSVADNRNKLVHAGQICAMFNLVPNKGVWVYEAWRGGPLIVDVGLEAYQQSTRRYEVETGRRLYIGASRLMTQDEVKAHLRSDNRYNDNIVGVEVSAVFDDEYREMGDFGVKKFYGFFWGDRLRQLRNGNWMADTTKMNESPFQKAERRAHRKMFNRMVGLRPPERTSQAAHHRMISVAKEADLAVNPPKGQIEETRTVHREPNGDILFPDEGEFRPVDDVEFTDDVDEGSAGAMPHQVEQPTDPAWKKAHRRLNAVGGKMYGDQWDTVRHDHVLPTYGVATSNALTVEQLTEAAEKIQAVLDRKKAKESAGPSP